MMSILEIINSNILALSEDSNIMHAKIDDMQKKIDDIYKVLYPTSQEQPNATGDAPVNS